MVRQTSIALDDGANEIDVVIPYRSLLAGDTDAVVALLDAVRDAAGDELLKVILETGELVDPDADPRRGATRRSITVPIS